jgi:hypothetical protein
MKMKMKDYVAVRDPKLNPNHFELDTGGNSLIKCLKSLMPLISVPVPALLRICFGTKQGPTYGLFKQKYGKTKKNI